MATIRDKQREERRLRILQGALDVFSSHGFRDSSIKDIAEAAELKSPGLIYHYFENKEELLKAALEHFAPPIKMASQIETLDNLPVRDGLLAIANAYLSIVTEPQFINSMRVLMSEAMHSEEFAHILADAGPLKIWTLVSRYMRVQCDRGSLQLPCPETAARCFMAPLFAHVFLRGVMRIPDPLNQSPADYASHCVDLFLSGGLPRGVKTDA